MTMRLDGSVALVTGAAGGIGRAVCAALKEAGATVVATDLADLTALPGADAYHRHDVTREADWARIAAVLGREHARLDVLVNAAAIAPVQSIENSTLEEWRKVQAVNVESIFIGTRTLLPLLKESGKTRKGGASIVNFSSVGVIAAHPLGRLGEPEEIGGGVVYLASAAASFVTGSELVIDGGFTAV